MDIRKIKIKRGKKSDIKKANLEFGELAVTDDGNGLIELWTGLADGERTVSVKGESGKAATIKVGGVISGEIGTNASVVNSGTENAAVFDFTIPCKFPDGAADASFDDLADIPGNTVSTAFGTSNFTEIIKNSSGVNVAMRVTAFPSSTAVKETITEYKPNGSAAARTIIMDYAIGTGITKTVTES